MAKTQYTRISGRFTGYSVEDCDCIYCLHYGGKRAGCQLAECCCLEERAEALKREQPGKQVVAACRG